MRMALRMSQRTYADKLGVPYWTYVSIIQGKRSPGKAFLGRVLDTYPDLSVAVQMVLMDGER